MLANRSLSALLHPPRPRRPGIRTVRLCSGLVLFTYVSLHLTNHALGNVSLAWMERGLLAQKFIWQGVIGTAALYSALAVHFCLGLYALYERRSLHWSARELTQLLLGLAIPPLLANHLAGTRVALAQFGLNKGYAQELYSFWIAAPGFGWIQLTLLIVAWTHGCFGLGFWLRLKPWFEQARGVLLTIAVLLPVLALLGYLQAGRAVVALAADPAWLAQATAPGHVGTAPQSLWLANLRNGFLVFDGTALALVVLARALRRLHDRRVGRVFVSYPDGRRQGIPIGFSVLEASLLAGVPHANMCGGRARCSLCRVRVMGGGVLPPVEAQERRVLARIGAEEATRVRLACQLRPTADIGVLPLVPPETQAAFLPRRAARIMPQERFLACMVVDMRGSTALAAARLPYDSVFIIGRFIAAVSSAVVQAGGVPNQFLGDGVLALFGLYTDERTACRQAVAAVRGVSHNIRRLGALLAREVGEPIRFGIGVQCGISVVGEIGFRDHVTFTALGDTPNVASRLETTTKDLGCEALITEEALRHAGLDGGTLPVIEVRVRGRAKTVRARVLHDGAADAAALLAREAGGLMVGAGRASP